MIYVLGLQMEDPDIHIEYLTTVDAETLDEAKQKWAEETGLDDEDWNQDKKTYKGFRVIQC